MLKRENTSKRTSIEIDIVPYYPKEEKNTRVS